MFTTQRSIILSVACSFFVWGAVGVLTGALLPDIVQNFSLSTTEAGLLIGFWSASFVAGSWISSRLVRWFSLKMISVAASGVTLTAFASLFEAGSIWLFAPAFGLVGVMMGVSVTIGHTLIGAAFPGQRTSMLSALDVVFSLGSICAPIGVIAIAVADLEWRAAYGVLSALFAIMMIGLGLFLPSITQSQESKQERVDDGPRNSAASKRSILLRTPYLLLLGLTGLFLGTVEWAQNSWIVSFALAHEASELIAQLAFAVYLGGMLLARVMTVFLALRLQTGYVAVWLLCLALVGNLLLLYLPGTLPMMAGNALIGFGIGAIFPIALGRAMDFDPMRASASSATLLMGVIAGSQIAATFLGWFADEVGGIDVAFHITTPFFILLIVSFALFRNRSTR